MAWRVNTLVSASAGLLLDLFREEHEPEGDGCQQPRSQRAWEHGFLRGVKRLSPRRERELPPRPFDVVADDERYLMVLVVGHLS